MGLILPLSVPKVAESKIASTATLRIYHTLSEFTGKPVGIADLVQLLNTMRRSEVIRVIANMAATVATDHGMKLGYQLQMAQHVLPDDVWPLVSGKIPRSDAHTGRLFHRRQVWFLLQMAIISCSETCPEMDLAVLQKKVGLAALMASDALQQIEQYAQGPVVLDDRQILRINHLSPGFIRTGCLRRFVQITVRRRNRWLQLRNFLRPDPGSQVHAVEAVHSIHGSPASRRGASGSMTPRPRSRWNQSLAERTSCPFIPNSSRRSGSGSQTFRTTNPLPQAGEASDMADGQEGPRAGRHSLQSPEGIADFHAAGRHTHITELLRNGASLTEAKELARHTNIEHQDDDEAHPHRYRGSSQAVQALKCQWIDSDPSLSFGT